MCESKLLQLQIILVVLCLVIKGIAAFDDAQLFLVTRAPKYLGVLQDHQGQPMSVEVSEEYMDRDYIANNKKHVKVMKTNDAEDFDEDDTDEQPDSKDKDIKIPITNNKTPLKKPLKP